MFSNKSGKHFEAVLCPIRGWGTLFGASRVARATTLDPMDQEPPKSSKKQLFWTPFCGTFWSQKSAVFLTLFKLRFLKAWVHFGSQKGSHWASEVN